MSFWRKKPIVIEAFRWTGSLNPAEDPDWITAAIRDLKILICGTDRLVIWTREGEMIVQPGDWIIRGVVGEIYPCKPEIFEATYERVEAAEAAGDET